MMNLGFERAACVLLISESK